jgi:DNA repair exonuclease SbcCD ATPase subunit
MAGFWGRRSRAEQERQAAADENLAVRARTAIVTTDERIRATDDELAFAVAELGQGPTQSLRKGLASVKKHMSEAFELHRLNHDEIPDTPEELRTRNARIVQLCDWAEEVLDERTEELQAQVEKVRGAPEELERVHQEVARLRAQLPAMRTASERLEATYSPSALQRLRVDPDEAQRLVDFAERSASLAQRRGDAGDHAAAISALEAVTETLRRAQSVMDGVDNFEIDALRAEGTLAEVIADSRGDLVAAAEFGGVPAVAQAMKALEAALAGVRQDTDGADPFSDLVAVSAANAALDDAVAAAREKAARPVPDLAKVRHEVETADRGIEMARRIIEGHRGWIGADARTNLAEAQRAREELEPLVGPEDTRERAQQLARRSAALADDAVRAAQRDIDSQRPDGDNWGDWGGFGGPRGGYGAQQGRGGGMLGPVLGGVLLGGILDDIFD